VKVLCSQRFVSLHLWGSSPIRSLRRRLHPGHHGVGLGSWLHKGGQEGMAWSKAIDFYALSWGVPRKPACNLADTAQRKSHPLEGSCQEAIPLPHTTFDNFFRLRSARHTPPSMGHLRRIRVFLLVASAPMCRTSHPSGSRPRDTSLLRQASAPGIVDAPENPRFPAMSNRI
jgi:hypothetical protein